MADFQVHILRNKDSMFVPHPATTLTQSLQEMPLAMPPLAMPPLYVAQ